MRSGRTFVVAAFLAVQVAVPTWMLFQPRPAPFGWQMYSALRSLPTVMARGEDGSEREVPVRDYIAGPRVELDYAALFAEQGCELIPAERLVITDEAGAVVEVRCP